MGSGSEDEIAVAAPKRSLFKKSTWAKPAEQDEALQLFSRSKEIFPDFVAENERRLKKLERSRPNTSAEPIDSTALDGKKRRVSKRSKDSGGSSSDNGPPAKHFQDGSIPNLTPPHKSSSSRASDSPKHEKSPHPRPWNRTGSVKRDSPQNDAKSEASIVDLSDSDNDLSIVALKSNKKTALIDLDLDSEDEEEEIIKPPKVVAPVVEPVSDEEEFPEFVAKAREGARWRPFERLDPTKSSAQSETLSIDGAVSKSTTSEGVRPGKQLPRAPDPIVQILVTSDIEGTKPLILKRKLSQRLKDVRLGWCDKQVLDGQPMPESTKRQIFLTWRKSKVFDVTTCKAMGIPIDTRSKLRADGEGFDYEGRIHLEAWTEEIFDQFKKREANQRKRRVLDPMEEMEEEEPEELQPKKERRIKIILISKDHSELKLDTSLMTPILKMREGFRTVNKLPSNAIITLQLDGEDLDPGSNVGDIEGLEDRMTIDVHLKYEEQSK